MAAKRFFRASKLKVELSEIYTDARQAPLAYFETAKDGVMRRWNSAYKHVKMFAYAKVMGFMAEVQWRILIR